MSLASVRRARARAMLLPPAASPLRSPAAPAGVPIGTSPTAPGGVPIGTAAPVALSRALLLKGVLLPSLALAAPTPGFLGFQSDDKSFDFTLPAGWSLSPSSGRVSEGSTLFKASASSADGAASVQVLVDLGSYGKNLAAFGSPEAAATKALPSGSSARLIDAAKVSGRIRGSVYYLARYQPSDAGREGLMKLGVSQDRLYRMMAEAPVDSPELQAQVREVVDSFQVFPVNFICISQSNKGSVPAPGSCY